MRARLGRESGVLGIARRSLGLSNRHLYIGPARQRKIMQAHANGIAAGYAGSGNVPAREPGGSRVLSRWNEGLGKLPRKSTGLVKAASVLAQGRKPRLVYNLAVRSKGLRASVGSGLECSQSSRRALR